MKTISDYTIYCTPEQTKKAIELGAKIEYHKLSEMLDISEQVIENGSIYYNTPTAEQMIGWIESLGGIEEITVCKSGMWIWGKNHTLIDSSTNYSSRMESSHAAIDAALDYIYIITRSDYENN